MIAANSVALELLLAPVRVLVRSRTFQVHVARCTLAAAGRRPLGATEPTTEATY